MQQRGAFGNARGSVDVEIVVAARYACEVIQPRLAVYFVEGVGAVTLGERVS
jgi:hypothetical protein